jgi:hypothetical protein
MAAEYQKAGCDRKDDGGVHLRDEVDLRSHDETTWIMSGTSNSDSGKFILERQLERILA